MASVTSITSAKADAISDKTIVDADLVSTSLIMTKKNGTQINVGRVAEDVVPVIPAIVTLTGFDRSPVSEDVIVPDWYTPGITPDKMFPSPVLASNGRGVAWSPESMYLAHAVSASPYVVIWRWVGSYFAPDQWNAVAAPAVLPTGLVGNMSFSSNGLYLAVPHATTPFLIVYKRSGTTFTKIADSASLPDGASTGSTWTYDSSSTFDHLAISMSVPPYLVVYKVSADLVVEDNQLPGVTKPTGPAADIAFAPNGQHLAVAHSTSPFISIYKRTSDQYAKLPNPSSLPTGNAVSVRWSADAQYLAVAHTTTPFVTIYKRSGDVFTKLANPAELPPSDGLGVAWSPDMQYLMVTGSTSPYFVMYRRNGDAFNRLPDMPSAYAPTGAAGPAAWAPDGTHMAISHVGGPYTTIYKSAFGLVPGTAVKATILP
jgi:hypothetical protein